MKTKKVRPLYKKGSPFAKSAYTATMLIGGQWALATILIGAQQIGLRLTLSTINRLAVQVSRKGRVPLMSTGSVLGEHGARRLPG